MAQILFELLFILCLAVLNGGLAMSEIAIVSARKARLAQQAAAGDRRAQIALDLAAEPTRFLSTVQIGITLIGILAGAVGGATLAEQLGLWIGRLPALAPYGEALGLGLVVLGITYLSLVIGELVPKRLALYHAERVALAVAQPMRRLSALTSPAVRLLSASTDAILRLLSIRPSAGPPVTEEELSLMLDEGTRAGVFEKAERDIVQRVLRLDARRVSSLATHRPEIVWLDMEDPPASIVEQITGSGFSRFPVGRGSLENILGIVEAKDLLARCVAGQSLDLKAVLHPPLFVPEGAELLDALERFRESHLPMALVIDEYGGLEGLLTLNDLLEAIVGDLPPAGEEIEAGAVRRADGSWLLDGALTIDECKEILELDSLPGEDEGRFETLGGFVMDVLGRVPSTADHFQSNDLCFEVMDMDGRRVDKVLVGPVQRGACRPDDL